MSTEVNVWEASACSINAEASISDTIPAVAVAKELQTATAGQTVFTLTQISYVPDSDNLRVSINGVEQYLDDGAYVETSTNTVTFTAGLEAGDVVLFVTNDYEATVPDASTSVVTVNSYATTVANALSALAVETITDLRAFATVPFPIAIVFGYTALGDSYPKLYYWEPLSVAADDGDTIIKLTAITTGRYIRKRDLVTATTAQLADITHAINTAYKFLGKQVFNTTLNKPVYATGSTAGSVWNDAVGVLAHTPV